VRVLMLIRTDARRVPGGDVVQMDQTRAVLLTRGVSADVHLVGEDICWSRYDLVHLFNIQTVQESSRACDQALRHRKPLVLSPIYWDPLPAWFRFAPDRRRVWRFLIRVMGRSLAYSLYAKWHRMRNRSRTEWQSQRQILTTANVLLPNSTAEAKQIVRDFRLPSATQERVMVVPNGIERSMYDPLPRPHSGVRALLGDRPFVLQVGRVSPEKNNLALIYALRNCSWPLVFVGILSPYHMDYVAEVRAAAAARGNVHFIDHLPHVELPGVYRLAAVHALPSWRETPGLASLEAAAAGCSIVSTCIGSAREYFGQDAQYCDPMDVDSITRAVETALASPPPAHLRERILEHYTWDVAAQKTYEGYQLALDSRSA